MKHSKLGVIALLLFGMVIALTGIVCADPGVNATPETQTLTTVTTAEVVGIVMETDAGVWTLTDDPRAGYTIAFPGGEMLAMQKSDYDQLIAAGGSFKKELFIPSSLLDIAMASGTYSTWGQYLSDLINNHGATATLKGGIHTGALDENQVQYTTAYDASIVAQGGKTSFLKQMNIDTRNKVTSQSNMKTQTGMTFAATADGGNVVGSENLMLDGAGDLTYAGERMLCPFGSGADALIPAFCNIVQSGSKYDLTIGSVTTTADERFVGTSANDPVVMNYAINIKPYSTSQGQFPASGSAMAYIKAHVQEARSYDVNLPVEGMNKSSDLTYTETASVSGTISAFNKDMHYSSQVTGPLPTHRPD